jgi:FKBP-type peptidyl-prolyl cis-trans isomerase
MQEIMTAFQNDLQERANARMQQQAEENLAEAEAFLEENKEREGVQVLEPGLQYMVMEEGEGESPPADATVTAHYSGTLLDGTEFDSSYDRGEPLQIAANQVIQGWTKALTNMKPGSKWKVWIHPDLAYGEQGRPTIPPNSLLVFEMELLSYE